MLKQNIQQLLQQPMTRREFLRNLGLMCLGILGVHSAINILSNGQAQTVINQHVQQAPRGFGSGKFGV